MKKLISIFALVGCLLAFNINIANAQGDSTNGNDQSAMTTTQTDSGSAMQQDTNKAASTSASSDNGEQKSEEGKGFQNVLKQKFIEGNPYWMTPVLICLIIGLALCIERIITLNLSSTNTRKLIARVNELLKKGDV